MLTLSLVSMKLGKTKIRGLHLWLAAAVLLIGGIGVTYALTSGRPTGNQGNEIISKGPQTDTGQPDTDEPTTPQTPGDNPSEATPPAAPTPTPPPAGSSSAPLKSPDGQVTNKGLKGSGASPYISLQSTNPQYSADMVSTCTAPGAVTCEVQAYQTDPAKAIIVAGPKAIDATGGAELTWNAKGKLSAGDWKLRLVSRKAAQSGVSASYTIEVRP